MGERNGPWVPLEAEHFPMLAPPPATGATPPTPSPEAVEGLLAEIGQALDLEPTELADGALRELWTSLGTALGPTIADNPELWSLSLEREPWLLALPGVQPRAQLFVDQVGAIVLTDLADELGAQFAVYWPGSLGYYTQGAIDETQTLRWYAAALNAACEHDIEVARKAKRPTLKRRDTRALPAAGRGAGGGDPGGSAGPAEPGPCGVRERRRSPARTGAGHHSRGGGRRSHPAGAGGR